MKRRTVCLNAVVFLVVSGGAHVASAHLPIFDDGTAVDPEHALVISDIGLSQVVYHEVQTPVQPLWIVGVKQTSPQLTSSPRKPRFLTLKERS